MIRAECLAYVRETRKIYSTFHDHVESSAWLAIVLFAIILTRVDYFQEAGAPVVIAMILVLSLTTFAFVFKKVQLKKESAYIEAACMKIELALLASADDGFRSEDFPTDLGTCGDKHTDRYLPKFLRDEVRCVRGEASPGYLESLDFLRYLFIVLLTLLALFSAFSQ